MGKIGKITFIRHPGVQKQIGIYHNIDEQLYSVNDHSTSCTNLVNFGPVTLEITRLQFERLR